MSQHLTKRFLVNVTEDELKHIDECVALSNLSRSQYTRMLYKKVIPRPCPSEELLETIQQLRRIGNNINQIAFVANGTGNIDTMYFKDCFKEVQEEILVIKDLILKPIPMEM